MVDLWCCLLGLMIGSRYPLGLRGGFLLVMVDFIRTCNFKLGFNNSDQKYSCIFSDHNSLQSVLRYQGCEVDGVGSKMVV